MALIGLLLATAVALRLVDGQEQFPYEVAIHFHEYSNPTPTIYDGTCCSIACLAGCDTALALCIRIGGTSHDSLDCPSGPLILGLIGGDYVTFTDAVGTLENPLVIPTNILPPSGYQLLIRSFNFVSLSLIEQIDNVFIKIPASTIEEPSPPDIYLGEFKPVTINLSYSMGCSPGYTLCSVNTVLQCVPEGVCIDGSESLSAFIPQTDLIVFPDRSPDINIPNVPMTHTSSHSFTSSFVLSVTPSSTVTATPSSSFSTNVATTAEAVPVAAIAGAVLGVLVFAVVIAILVVVGVAIAHHKRKKKQSPASEANTYMTYSELYRENSVHNSSQPTTALTHPQPSEHIDYEEVGDRAQGNTYEAVDPDKDPESTMVNVANPVYHQPTTLSESKEPLYEEAQADQDRSRSNTLTEVSNPMYGTTQAQGGEELEYQEMQREVENELYRDRIDADLDSKD